MRIRCPFLEFVGECAHTRMRQLSRHDANFGLLEVVSTTRLPVDLEGFQVSRSLLEKWQHTKQTVFA